MEHSTDERHAATLQLLEEALDLLLRLPTVPVTRDLCRKIEAHLQEPGNALIQRAQAHAGLVFEGDSYTAAGLPLLQARVVVPTDVKVWATKPSSAEAEKKISHTLLAQLYGGGFNLQLHRAASGASNTTRFTP